jgi:hypothetical protein
MGNGQLPPKSAGDHFLTRVSNNCCWAQETLSDPVEEAVKKLISPYRADDTTVKRFFVCAEKQRPCHRRS